MIQIGVHTLRADTEYRAKAASVNRALSGGAPHAGVHGSTRMAASSADGCHGCWEFIGCSATIGSDALGSSGRPCDSAL